MELEKIQELFSQGIDCSQVITGYFAAELGIDADTARKVSACFGGGMHCGATCGAVTGAYMVLGLKYGHAEEGEMDQKLAMLGKMEEFNARFARTYDSTVCKDLLGYDLSVPEDQQKVMDAGLLFNFCPQIVKDTIGILEQVMA